MLGSMHKLRPSILMGWLIAPRIFLAIFEACSGNSDVFEQHHKLIAAHARDRIQIAQALL